MTYPTSPTNITDYTWFLYNVAQIPVAALPTDSVWIGISYKIALDTVNCLIREVSCDYYNMAVYNFATDYLINWCPDVPGQDYFKELRAAWDLTGFVGGVVESTADESTSTSLAVPDSLRNLTISDLQNLKTPFGRAYLAIAQKFGDIWGLS